MSTDTERIGVAIVTGATSGIGYATALLLAERGYDVGFTYHTNNEGAAGLVTELEALGRAGRAAQLDQNDPSMVEPVVERLSRDLGGLDGFINNAAVDHRSSFVAGNTDDWERVLRIDLLGPLVAARAAARVMLRLETRGSIVNVTSVLDSLPVTGGVAYAAAKAGLGQATQVMALELAQHGIRVNAVAPGHTSTAQNFGPDGVDPRRGVYPEIPIGRPAHATEIAEAIAHLLGEGAAYVTGSRLLIDGGLSLVSGPQTLESAVGYSPQSSVALTRR